MPPNKGPSPQWKRIPLLARDGMVVAWTRVDADDYGQHGKHTWRLSSDGYAVRSETKGGKKQTVYLHREVAKTPLGLLTDHANGNRLDNRRSNLRVATRSENGANSADRIRQSGYRGVYFHRTTGRWVAQISDGGRPMHLGIFDTPEEAAAVYDLEAERRWGDYARTNQRR